MGYIRHLIPRLLIIAVLFGVAWYSLNTVVRRVVVQTWRQKTSTDIEIGNIKTQLDPTQVVFENIRVFLPDEKQDTIATLDKMSVQFDRGELLRRHFLATDTRLCGIKLELSGLGENGLDLSKYWNNVQSQFADLAAHVEKIPFDALLTANPDEAAKQLAQQFETYQLSDNLKQKWETEALTLKTQAQSIESRFKMIKQQVDTTKQSPDQLQLMINILQQIDLLDRDVAGIQKSVPALEQKLQTDRDALNRAIANDNQKIKDITAPKINSTSLSEYILGDEMRERLTGLIAWIDWGRSQVPDNDTTWLDPVQIFPTKRSTGENIALPNTEKNAEVQFAAIGVDGKMIVWDQPIFFSGGIRDYTNQPKRLQKPLVLRFCISGNQISETLPDDYLKLLAENDPERLFRLDEIRIGMTTPPNAVPNIASNDASQTWQQHQGMQNVDFFRIPESVDLSENSKFVLSVPTLYVTALLDRTGEVPHDRFLISCPEYYLPQRTVGNPQQLAFTVSPGMSQFRAVLEIKGDALTGSIKLLQSPVTVQAALPPTMKGTPIERGVQAASSSLTFLQAQIDISGTRQNPTYVFQSNIGDLLAMRVEDLLKQEWNLAHTKMLSLLNQKISGSVTDLNTGFASEVQPLFSMMTANRQQLGLAFEQNGIDVNQLFRSQMSRFSEKDQQQLNKLLGNPLTQALLSGRGNQPGMTAPGITSPGMAATGISSPDVINQTIQQNVTPVIDEKVNDLINKHVTPEVQNNLRGILGTLNGNQQQPQPTATPTTNSPQQPQGVQLYP